jgi:hypothetical protein
MSRKIMFVVSRNSATRSRLSTLEIPSCWRSRLSFLKLVSQSRLSTLKIPSCRSRLLFLVMFLHREFIAPAVVRACRYLVYMYGGSTHLRLLVVQVLFIHGGILPFATNIASARLLRVVLLCMCKCMCKWTCMSCAGAVQVQGHVLCGCSFR